MRQNALEGWKQEPFASRAGHAHVVFGDGIECMWDPDHPELQCICTLGPAWFARGAGVAGPCICQADQEDGLCPGCRHRCDDACSPNVHPPHHWLDTTRRATG